MLNKGPHPCDTVGTLDDILLRMQGHKVKTERNAATAPRW
jgi:hypothetical protein